MLNSVLSTGASSALKCSLRGIIAASIIRKRSFQLALLWILRPRVKSSNPVSPIIKNHVRLPYDLIQCRRNKLGSPAHGLTRAVASGNPEWPTAASQSHLANPLAQRGACLQTGRAGRLIVSYAENMIQAR